MTDRHDASLSDAVRSNQPIECDRADVSAFAERELAAVRLQDLGQNPTREASARARIR
jgi:hypothetical protein